MPLAIQNAVLRHRLYDLDVVIKKTVVFAIIVVLLVAVGGVVAVLIGFGLVPRLYDTPPLFLFFGLACGLLAAPVYRLASRIADRVVYGGRARPSEVLSEFSERLSETYATDDVLPRMVTILGEATRAKDVRVWLRVGNEYRAAAAWPAEVGDSTVVIASGDVLPAFPVDAHRTEVRDRGELLGAITATFHANDPIDEGRERLIRDMAAQAGLVLRNVRLIENLRASRQRMVTAQDEGRRRLERNIHDGAQQQLVALSVKTRLADSMIDRDAAKAHEMLAQIQTDTNDALETLRDLARGIYPPLLADKGLPTALEAQARKVTIPVTLDADGIGRFPAEAEATVYFCVLEALQNIAKYADASTITVRLRSMSSALTFDVRDDGVGFDPASHTPGTGHPGDAGPPGCRRGFAAGDLGARRRDDRHRLRADHQVVWARLLRNARRRPRVFETVGSEHRFGDVRRCPALGRLGCVLVFLVRRQQEHDHRVRIGEDLPCRVETIDARAGSRPSRPDRDAAQQPSSPSLLPSPLPRRRRTHRWRRRPCERPSGTALGHRR